MADKQINWYVLYARTGAEEKLVEQLKNEFDKDHYLPFIPKKTVIYRRKGVNKEFQQICFPGYVFLESDKPSEEVINDSKNIIYKLKNAYRFLSYGDKSDITMREDERLALSKLFGPECSIDISKGFKEGDKAKIISGALFDFEGTIKRINTSQKQAVIGVWMFGTVTDVIVGLEIVYKHL